MLQDQNNPESKERLEDFRSSLFGNSAILNAIFHHIIGIQWVAFLFGILYFCTVHLAVLKKFTSVNSEYFRIFVVSLIGATAAISAWSFLLRYHQGFKSVYEISRNFIDRLTPFAFGILLCSDQGKYKLVVVQAFLIVMLIINLALAVADPSALNRRKPILLFVLLGGCLAYFIPNLLVPPLLKMLDITAVQH